MIFGLIGNGCSILLFLGLGVTSALVAFAVALSSAERVKEPNYWVALGCLAQPLVSALVLTAFDLPERGPGPLTTPVVTGWGTWMVFVGFLVLLLWPDRRSQ